MNKRIVLPDFGKFFHTKNRSPVDFVCREGANLLHDFVYLRSYLHDATFKIESVRLRGKVLRLPLERDRWELHARGDQLQSISSELVIAPIVSMKWQSKSKARPTRKSANEGKFFIRDVYLGESFWDATDRAEIVLSGFGRNPTQLRIVVREPFNVRLLDITRRT